MAVTDPIVRIARQQRNLISDRDRTERCRRWERALYLGEVSSQFAQMIIVLRSCIPHRPFGTAGCAHDPWLAWRSPPLITRP